MKKILLTLFAFLVLVTPFSSVPTTSRIQKVEAADTCSVYYGQWNPAGEQNKDTFFKEGTKYADIIVKTKDCKNQTLYLTVLESDTGISADDTLSGSGLERKPIVVKQDNFTVRIQLGEEECESGFTVASGYDCDLF